MIDDSFSFVVLVAVKLGGKYFVVTDRWQKFTEFEVNAESLTTLAKYCDEFLVHGVDVEGKRCGIIEELVELVPIATQSKYKCCNKDQ